MKANIQWTVEKAASTWCGFRVNVNLVKTAGGDTYRWEIVDGKGICAAAGHAPELYEAVENCERACADIRKIRKT